MKVIKGQVPEPWGIELVCAILLLVIALFGDAIIEWLTPDRIERRIEAVEERAAQNSTWRDHPNDSTCGHRCIARIGDGKEEWK